MSYTKCDIPTLLRLASNGDQDALTEVLNRFDPLISIESQVHGHLNEDMAQDVRESLIKAIKAHQRFHKLHE